MVRLARASTNSTIIFSEIRSTLIINSDMIANILINTKKIVVQQLLKSAWHIRNALEGRGQKVQRM
jgi:hypothetical protein